MPADPGSQRCPTEDALSAFVYRTLEDDELARVMSHLDGCDDCRQIVIAAMRDSSGPADRAVSATETATPELAAGQVARRLGRYEIRALLGAGAMGAVYEAHDVELDRAIALKVLRPAPGNDAGVLAERLLRESRLMAKVAHSSVITVHDVGRDGDAVYIAMELIRGQTLASYLATTALDWRAIVSLFERAADGLAAAHAAGIVHRDFKPDNVLVEHGARRVVVSDFGVSRVMLGAEGPGDAPGLESSATGDPRLTATGTAIGTPAYAAPEQLAGQTLDHRADVFAFSVSLWEALFGTRPFPGNTVGAIFSSMLASPVRPGRDARRGPRRLVRALKKGLALEPRDRWSDMAALRAELAAIRTRRRRIALAASGTAMAGAMAAIAFVVAQPAEPRDPCARGIDRVTAAFRPDLRAVLSSLLAGAPETRTTVLARLDSAAAAWRDTHRATCDAGHEPVQPMTTAACLEARRIELDGFIQSVLADGADGVKYAPELINVVGDPAMCATPVPGLLLALVPEDPAQRPEVTRLRRRLVDAVAADGRSEYQRALDLAQSAVNESAALWPPLHAEALFLLGAIHVDGGDSKLGRTVLREAATLAERVHHDVVAIRSWTQLVTTTAFDGGDPVRALEYAGYAEAAVDRIGRPASYMVVLGLARGGALIEAGRFQEGEAVLREATRLARERNPELVSRTTDALAFLYRNQGRYADAADTYHQAIEELEGTAGGKLVEPVLHEQLAMCLAWLGRLEEAEREARRATEAADHSLPDGHMDRVIAHGVLALVLRSAGRYNDALAESTPALAALARREGERGERYGELLRLHGEILETVGRHAQADATLVRACEIIAFAMGDGAEAHAECELKRSTALASLHRHREALATLERAVPALIKYHGESHPLVAEAILRRGISQAALGQVDAAIQAFERAIAIFSTAQVEPGPLAAARAALGKALWRRDSRRARAEVAAAAKLFDAATPVWSRAQNEAATWLKSHRGPRK